MEEFGRLARQRSNTLTLKEKNMKTQRILIALTVINLGMLMFQLTALRRVEAVTPASGETASPAPVLRGSSLEIVDDQGRVRASIKIHAGDPKF